MGSYQDQYGFNQEHRKPVSGWYMLGSAIGVTVIFFGVPLVVWWVLSLL